MYGGSSCGGIDMDRGKYSSRGDKSTTQYPLVYLNRNNEIGIIQVRMNFEVLTVDTSKIIAYLEV